MKKVLLIIRDGWGYNKHIKGNAARNAKVPNNNYYEKHYPWTILKCSGNAVGLPEGTQGGSEPGHLTIGAGRVVWQPYELINRHIRDGSFDRNRALLDAIKNCKKHNSSLHLMGLFSDQGIHGTSSHLYSLLKLAKKKGLKNVFVHCFLDGRDVPEKSARVFIKDFLKKSKEIGLGKIGSMIGRYFAMDRDNNWKRTKRAYKLLVEGVGFRERDPLKAIENAYERGEESKHEGRAEDTTDYYIGPIIMVDDDWHHFSEIKDKDSVIFWNFRSDRTRQITYALTAKKFDKFYRGHKPKIFFVCMSEYEKDFKLPVAFPQQKVMHNLGSVVAGNNLKQLRIAETEKYAHVTFFFNSQIEELNKGEDRMMVHSPKVASYDLKPEMSAYEVTDKLIPQIGNYDLIVCNFANCDLVGHSGKLKAGIKACEVVDECCGKMVDVALTKDYAVIITGDHGNVEIMFYPDGTICPAHGTNPVPFFVIGKDRKLQKIKLKRGKGLSDVAPTILDIMGIKKPKEMTGESLIEK